MPSLSFCLHHYHYHHFASITIINPPSFRLHRHHQSTIISPPSLTSIHHLFASIATINPPSFRIHHHHYSASFHYFGLHHQYNRSASTYNNYDALRTFLVKLCYFIIPSSFHLHHHHSDHHHSASIIIIIPPSLPLHHSTSITIILSLPPYITLPSFHSSFHYYFTFISLFATIILL